MEKKNLNLKKRNSNTYLPETNVNIYNSNDNEKEEIIEQDYEDNQQEEETNIENNEISNKSQGIVGNALSSKFKFIKEKIKIKAILILLTLIISLLLGCLIVAFFIALFTSNNSIVGGYYNARCKEITVLFADKNDDYRIVDIGEYSLTDYVAGVVAAEVGSLENPEIYKTFAIAARTYVQMNADSTCSIESSDRQQVFRDVTNNQSTRVQKIYEAVRETGTKVLIQDGNLYNAHYDAFCSIAVDNNYYTIKQQNQKIPKKWVDSQGGIAESWKQGTCEGNHGMGISQWGAYYLASEQNYTYEEIIDYYLGTEGVTISQGFISSIGGLEIKDTTDATHTLDIPLGEYLEINNSSIGEYDNYIRDTVISVGAGTREGVVAAAVSMINFLYDNFNTKLPYYWGGNYQYFGMPSNFGAYSKSSESSGGNFYYYKSFDCSGFVSWAIKNGGYNISRQSTSGFNSKFSGDSCYITDSNCIGQVGDLINASGSHVQLIIAVFEEQNKYYIAESSGNGVVMTSVDMHSPIVGASSDTKILHLDDFYNDDNNKVKNY